MKNLVYNVFMAIISNTKEEFGKYCFVFNGDDILLTKMINSPDKYSDYLPQKELVLKLLENQIVSDWYFEEELNYSAFMLEKDSPIPKGLIQIPIRQFFWNSKSEDEQNSGILSFIGNLAARALSFLKQRDSFRFCPTCSGKLTDHKILVAKKCSICGRDFFPRVEPAIIVLVSKNDEVLLVKNRNHKNDIYSCVAGFVEQGESIEDCVIREVKEETNISIKNLKYISSQVWPFPSQLMLGFTAEYESGEIKIQEEELLDANWFKKDSLPPLPNPGSVAYNLIKGIWS